jgi:hypothetical protein
VGWNQVSLSFYAPRWQEQFTPDPTALTYSGQPVQVASAVPVAGAASPPVPAAEVIGWLAGRGLALAGWGRGRVLERGRVRSIGGPTPDVVVHVNGEAEDVSDLYCRFALPGRTPPDLAGWAAFAAELCGRFGLRLAPGGAGTCGEAEFVAAVRANGNYREFAARFGWEAGPAEPGAAANRRGMQACRVS